MAHRVSASVLVCIVLVAESALRGVDRCMCERVRGGRRCAGHYIPVPPV